MADIFVFLKNNIFKNFFTKLQYKKLNGLHKKDFFKVILISNILSKIKIFNLCFVNEIKNKKEAIIFKKSRLVFWIYNNYDKEEILTQSFTIKQIT